MNEKKGQVVDTTTLVIAGTLILSAIVLVAFTGKFTEFFAPGSANDAEKISPHIKKINELTAGAQPGKFEERLAIAESELLLYYSAGTAPIKLLYKGNNPQDNGHYIIARPKATACDNKACVCYCHQGLFWRNIETKPYLEPRRLFSQDNISAIGWECTNMICEATDDEYIVFTNSRGQDNQFTQDAVNYAKQNEFQAIPLQIPVLLQGKYEGDNIYFDDQKDKHIEYLTLDYEWEGGVALGGYAYSPYKKTRKDKNLEVPDTPLTVELSTKDHVIGICLQETCLYPNALAHAQVNVVAIQGKEQAEQRFSNLVQYLLNDFPYCMQNAGVSSAKELCAFSLQNQLALASTLDATTNPYTIALEETTQGKTIFQLVKLEQGQTTTIDSLQSTLIYPYTQTAGGTPTPLTNAVHLTKNTQGNLSLSTTPSVPTKLSVTVNTQATDDVIVFISS